MSELNGRAVLVTLDRERHLRYTFNSVCRLQETLGTSIDRVLGRESLGFVEMRAFLWAGLIHEDRDLTVEGAGELVQVYVEREGELDSLFAHTVDALRKSGLAGKAETRTEDEETNPLEIL